MLSKIPSIAKSLLEGKLPCVEDCFSMESLAVEIRQKGKEGQRQRNERQKFQENLMQMGNIFTQKNIKYYLEIVKIFNKY
jgi:hypothetical protein